MRYSPLLILTLASLPSVLFGGGKVLSCIKLGHLEPKVQRDSSHSTLVESQEGSNTQFAIWEASVDMIHTALSWQSRTKKLSQLEEIIVDVLRSAQSPMKRATNFLLGIRYGTALSKDGSRLRVVVQLPKISNDKRMQRFPFTIKLKSAGVSGYVRHGVPNTSRNWYSFAIQESSLVMAKDVDGENILRHDLRVHMPFWMLLPGSIIKWGAYFEKALVAKKWDMSLATLFDSFSDFSSYSGTSPESLPAAVKLFAHSHVAFGERSVRVPGLAALVDLWPNPQDLINLMKQNEKIRYDISRLLNDIEGSVDFNSSSALFPILEKKLKQKNSETGSHPIEHQQTTWRINDQMIAEYEERKAELLNLGTSLNSSSLQLGKDGLRVLLEGGYSPFELTLPP